MKRGAWLRGHMLGFALLLGGHTWAGELTDAGTPVADAGGPGEPDEKPAVPRSEPPASGERESEAEREFRGWVNRRARAENLRLTALWRGDLDGDGAPERVALRCSPDPIYEQASWYVLERSPDEHWVLEWHQNQPGTCRWGVPSVAPHEWSVMGAALQLRDSYSGWESVDHIALRDGWPAIVSRWSEYHDFSGQSIQREAWDALQGSRWTHERARGEENRYVSTEFALLPVLAAEAPLPPTLNRIPVGRKHHSGEADASLRVSVLREGPDAVRVRLEVRDDVPRPVPDGTSAARFLAANHLELWWRPDERVSCEETLKASCSLRQLGLALRESGGVEARWLYPKKAKVPLPQAELRDGRVEVVIPLSLFGHAVAGPFEGLDVPFTAVFSDSDEDSGQQTLIATSDLQWGVPASFGSLVFTEGGRRHPSPKRGAVDWRRLEGKTRIRGE